VSRTLNTRNAPQCGIEPELATDAQRNSLIGHPVMARQDLPADRQMRRMLRRSYGCNCSGDADLVVRECREQADAALEVIEDWTGIDCRGCPWMSLRDTFVERVFDAWQMFDKGQLDIYRPDISHREMQGVLFLQTMIMRIDAHKVALERANKQSQQG